MYNRRCCFYGNLCIIIYSFRRLDGLGIASFVQKSRVLDLIELHSGMLYLDLHSRATRII